MNARADSGEWDPDAEDDACELCGGPGPLFPVDRNDPTNLSAYCATCIDGEPPLDDYQTPVRRADPWPTQLGAARMPSFRVGDAMMADYHAAARDPYTDAEAAAELLQGEPGGAD